MKTHSCVFGLKLLGGKIQLKKKKKIQNFFGDGFKRKQMCKAEWKEGKESISALNYGVIMKSKRGKMGWEETFATGPEEEETQFRPDEKSRAE